MARTRSSTDNAGGEEAEPTATENQRLRQQLREMAQQLAALTEHVRGLRQPPVTSVVVAPAPPAEATLPTTGPPDVDGETTTAPAQTAAAGASRVPPAAPSSTTTPAASGPPSGAAAGDPSRGPVMTPAPVESAAVIGTTIHPQTEREKARSNLAEFLKYHPPVFEGETTDPWDVEKWVDTMEKLFEDLMMEEHERVPLAVHFLEGNARIWWKTVRPDPPGSAGLPSWAAFREKLFGAFFSHSVKQQLEDDLKHIKQGSRTVMEYQREFVRLVNCVPFVVRNEAHKAQLFVDGLRSDIFQVVQAADLHTFQKVVDRATLVERGFAVTRARREGRDQDKDKKRPQSHSGGGYTGNNRPSKYPKAQQGTRSAQTGGQRQGEKPCVICGGGHRVNECSKRQDHCYRCGKPGHFRHACPLNVGSATATASGPAPQQTGRGKTAAGSTPQPSAPRREETRPSPGGRVYSMTHQMMNIPEDVVAGIILVSDYRARTLFDTGASLSFMSHSFARTHEFKRAPLSGEMIVSTLGGPLKATSFVPSCPIRLGRIPCPWDLVVIPLEEYDVILGMDWLAEYQALIDCEKRQVRLQKSGLPEHVYLACKSTSFLTIISASRARRMVKRGCMAFLASVDLTPHIPGGHPS